MDKDMGFAVVFFGIILLAAFSSATRQEVSSQTATSTNQNGQVVTREIGGDTTISAPTGGNGQGTPSNPTSAPTPVITAPKTDREIQTIEREILSIYRELDQLSEKLREAKLREPVSPYAGSVELRIGNAKSFILNEEYLHLTANSRNINDVVLTGWSLQSYVTGVHIALPVGSRVPESGGARVTAPITLRPDEVAYVHTGGSPAGFSFQENICTGYLADEGTFYPTLKNNCPVPLDELGRFGGRVARDGDCSDYVRSLRRCAIPSSTALRTADISRDCRSFIENTLTYDDCVLLHRADPAFATLGAWHAFLGQRIEIWRSEREIIRLLDSAGRVVDYIEY